MLTDRSRTTIAARRFTRAALACSSLAIAVVLTSAPARAQSFQGAGTVVSGSATILTPTPTTTTISNISSNAVIDWTTFDIATGGGPINFQPSGTTATFSSGVDFSVLNRIIPTDPSRAIQFNGTVIGQIQSTMTAPGGSVYFYSPGGVIVGSTAVFNVGNLGLTSIAPAVVGGVFEQPGTAGDEFVQFNGAVTAGSAVRVLAGAQINATGAANNSYVALVAPVVDQRGTINVNGQAVLVSADAVTVTFRNSGLFDIQVTSGTSGNLGGFNSTLSNSGTITGPVSSGAGDNHRVYAVAVPKNTAITLAIGNGASLGFNVAGAADVVGNAVVLSAGKDIVGGAIAGASPGGGSGAADLNIAGTTITSALTGSSTRDTSLFSTTVVPAAPTTHAFSSVSLQGDTSADIAAEGAGASVIIDGAVTLNAQRAGNGVTGGQTDIFAINGGQLSITSGGATLNSRGFGFNGATPGAAGSNATGGLALITATTGGDVSITGPVNIQAGGFGGSGNAAAGGTGTGGLAQIFARDAGSSITINGLANVGADGIGGVGNGGAAGGVGTGGQAFVNAQVAASDGIVISGATGVQAIGVGGNANSGPAGAGFGGNSVVAASVNNTIQIGSTLNIFAAGTGGNVSGSGAAGSGTGGTARINLFGTGTLSVASNAQVSAVGQAGIGNPSTALGTGNIAAVGVQQNSALNVTGSLQVFASGLGDRSFMAVPTNGGGVGGTATVDAFTNGTINVGSVLRTRSDATAANGRNATAGTAIVAANSGGDITANQLNVSADGVGGSDTGAGAGFGRGGTASLFASGAGSTVNIANGNSTGSMSIGELDFISAEGFGGATNGGGSGVGGAAIGGTANMGATAGGVITGPTTGGTNGLIRIFARGTGGGANAGVAGGTGTGGTINIFADAATLTSFDLHPSVFGLGGSVLGTPTGAINGGNAVGGTRNITVNNGGSITTAFAAGTAGGIGGNASATGRGGDASGGTANLTVDNGSTLNLTGSSGVFTGNSGGSGLNNGNASGGTAFVRFANGSTVTMAGPVTNVFNVGADAQTSSPLAPTTGSGGTITAGTSTLLIENATFNAKTVNVSASANTFPAFYAQGTTGTGGSALLQLIGATLTADKVSVSAFGSGGSLNAGQSGVGGTGTGGLARIIATGGTSTATVTQSIGIGADGLGGDVGGAAGTTTGNGIGGRAALVVSNGASLTLSTPDVFLSADGEGGEAVGQSDIGGDGTGGLTDVFANGGNLTINGNLSLEADNDGGEGTVGGDGLRRTDGVANALLRAQNGSITVTGLTTLASVGEGDSGGSASGGLVLIDPQNSLAGPSTITLNNLILNATARGGNGAGAPSPSAPGGDGSDAFGGQALALGSAGNGRLVINGSTVLDASATGGTGGTGHPGATGTAGGRGGDATGGNIQFGTKSGGLDTGTVNIGSAQFAGVQAVATATGGAGGVGGSGTTQGGGGAGGDAFGGGVTLLVRGSPATFSLAPTLNGNAFGGNGGAGATQGAGGNATVGGDGGVGILATSRFMQPTQLGRLTAPGVFGTAFATGGAGSTAGAANLGGQPLLLQFDGASGTIGDISLDATGTALAGALPSLVSLTSGQLDIANSLRVTTTGSMTLALDRFVVNVPVLTLRAANFVLPSAAPVSAGTFNVSSGLDLRSNLDFVTYANFNVPFNTSFSWAGAFQVGNYTGGGDLFLDAVGPVTFASIVGGDVELASDAGITTGAITATRTIDLAATGTVTTGALTAGDAVLVQAGGALNVGNVSAGLVNPATTAPDGYTIGLRSLASVTAGNLSARGSVGVASPGSIAVGNVTTGSSGLGFLALAGTGLTTGSIDTTASPNGGQVYLANFSMEALGGQIGGNFDPAPILAATPVAIGGPITINGAVNTRLFRAASTQGYTSGAITTSDTVSIDVTGPITLTGAVTSGRSVFLVSRSGSVSGQAITAGNAIGLSGLGSITVGNLSAGVVNRSTATGANYQVQLGSGASVVTGNILTTGQALLRSLGTLTSGAITARDILVLASTGIATGALSTGSIDPVTLAVTRSGRILLADRSMTGVPASFAAFDPEPIFAATPIAMSGPINTGAVSTDTFRASATGTVAVGNVTSLNTLLNGVAGVSTGTVTAGQSASFFSSGGGVSAGVIQAGDSISVNAMGAVTLGNLSAGLVQPSTSSSALLRVALASGAGSISTGTIGAGRDIGIQAAQAITTGNIAGRDVLLLPGTSLNTGSIQALNGTQATGRVYVGNFSMVSPTNGNVFAVFGNLPLFNVNPVRTSGAITIGGTVTAGSFKAASTPSFAAGAITLPTNSTTFFSELYIDSGQTITVNGPWRAGFMRLTSNDIDITSTGTLTGFVELLSRNPNGAFIGDGITGTGYNLSNAEFNRISGGFGFEGIDTTQAVDLLIGNLTIDAAKFAEDEGIFFDIDSPDTSDERAGRIRVDGNVTATNASRDSSGEENFGISFFSKVFELNAATGSVTIANPTGGLGGEIDIDADNIHVADDAILMKLRADPFYAGHVAELNAPAAVQRPDGVLRANSLELEGDRTIYIQNTGSVVVPAGFVTRVDNDDEDGTDIGPEDDETGAAKFKIVINGQVQTDTGLVTGRAAFDLIIAAAKADLDTGETFAADLDPESTLNGCNIISSVCAFGNSDPVSSISSEIKLAIINQLADAPVPDVIEEAADSATESADEEASQSAEEEDEAEADEASSPIAPPAPLINTRPLNPAVNVVEPVAGAGNPALIGSAVNEATAQGDTP